MFNYSVNVDKTLIEILECDFFISYTVKKKMIRKIAE